MNNINNCKEIEDESNETFSINGIEMTKEEFLQSLENDHDIDVEKEFEELKRKNNIKNDE